MSTITPVTTQYIDQLITSDTITPFYTTVNAWFGWAPYEQEVEIVIDAKNALWWKYKGSMNFWRSIEYIKHCDFLFINYEVVYYKTLPQAN